MKRSKSTISRELSHNSSEVHKVYLPDTAEETVAAIKSAKAGQVKSFVNLQEQDKVRSLPITDIENLAEALLDFNGIADLEIWVRENIV